MEKQAVGSITNKLMKQYGFNPLNRGGDIHTNTDAVLIGMPYEFQSS